MMKDCNICFTTDTTYLFPTLVSAIQARKQSSESLADVSLYHIGASSKESDVFAKICECEGVAFASISPSITENAHVAYSRLFLDRFVPAKYTQLLYIDGDTQVVGSLDSLIESEVPAGHFLAATDPIAFKYASMEEAPSHLQDYFARVGVRDIKQYFNSGVLRINREKWSEVGLAAFERCRENSSKKQLHFWDQDGLNQIATETGARLKMSLKYNFPIFLRNCRVEDQVRPVIYHFMSNPKPWNGNFPPWNAAASLPYTEICNKYPALLQYQSRFGFSKNVKYFLQQRLKLVEEKINWGYSKRRGELLGYENQLQAVATLETRA